MYIRFFKPIFDFLFALTLLVFSLPLLLIIGIILGFEHKGSIFFTQERAKKHGQSFKIIKFRTLKDLPNATDLERLSTFGNFLRATALDELPQLINILRGEMSFIGPRPLYVFYNEKYTATEKQRLSVKPGITGWAQVHGGNHLSWQQKFELDVWYVTNLNFLTDMQVLFKTISYLVHHIDLSSKTHLQAKEFEGTIN